MDVIRVCVFCVFLLQLMVTSMIAEFVTMKGVCRFIDPTTHAVFFRSFNCILVFPVVNVALVPSINYDVPEGNLPLYLFEYLLSEILLVLGGSLLYILFSIPFGLCFMQYVRKH